MKDIASISKYVDEHVLRKTFNSIEVHTNKNNCKDKLLYVFDLRKAYWVDRLDNYSDKMNNDEGYDLTMFVVTIQGIVNRDSPNLLVYGYFSGSDKANIDKYWIDKFMEPGQWLEDYELVEVQTVEELIFIFRHYIEGIIVWDPNVDSTVNIATSLAGIMDSPIVMCEEIAYSDTGEESLYHKLTTKLHLTITKNLNGMFTGEGIIPGTNRKSTASKKVDAYKWMKIHYLDKGLLNPKVIAYYEDAYARRQGTNILNWEALRDYVVAKKGFIVDLFVWGDEKPTDDPLQPQGLDLSMLHEILITARKQAGNEMIIGLGFLPWNDKYTSVVGGNRDPVPCEWELVKIMSKYNIYLTPDVVNQGFTGNLSLHFHAPFPKRVWQNPRPKPRPLENKTYVTFYVGDYCDIGGIYHILPSCWDAKSRGKIPLEWAITPMHIKLVPGIMSYLYTTATDMDYFTAGPNGVGYNMTSYLSNLREFSQLDASIEYSREYFARLNYSITSFYIDWKAPDKQVKDFHFTVSPDGLSANHDPGQLLYKGRLPVNGMIDLTPPGGGCLDDVVKKVYKSTKELTNPGHQPNFLHFRTIFTSPDFLVQLVERIKSEMPDFNYEIVDPYTFYYLMRQYEGGTNNYRASYHVSGMPENASTNKELSLIVSIRNDGWDTWVTSDSKEGQYELRATWILKSDWRWDYDLNNTNYIRVDIPGPVKPQEAFQVQIGIKTPSKPGEYILVIDMACNKTGWFTNANGNCPFEKKIELKKHGDGSCAT